MAKLIFHLVDQHGNEVDIETPETELTTALDNYGKYVEVLAAKGFTQVKHNSTNGGKPKPKLIQIDGHTCPVCGAHLFDNREKKASGTYKATSPDFSCGNQSCSGPDGKRFAVWPGQYELTT